AGHPDPALADGDHRDPDADRHRQEERDPDGRLRPGQGTRARPVRPGRDPRSGAGALPPDHHDHAGGDGRGAAAGDRLRHRFGNAPAARHRHRRRPAGFAAADPAQHPGDLPVESRPQDPQGGAQGATGGEEATEGDRSPADGDLIRVRSRAALFSALPSSCIATPSGQPRQPPVAPRRKRNGKEKAAQRKRGPSTGSAGWQDYGRRFFSSSRCLSAALPTSFCNLPAFFSILPATCLPTLPVTLPTPSLMAPLTSCLVPSLRFLSTHVLRIFDCIVADDTFLPAHGWGPRDARVRTVLTLRRSRTTGERQARCAFARQAFPLPQAGRLQAAASTRAAPMLRNAGLPMQLSAIAVSSRPAPANNSVSEISFSRLPAIAAEIGPSPMKVNISTLMVRPIISGATRRWIQLMMVICAMPPSMPVPASSTAPVIVECTSAMAASARPARLSMARIIRPSRPRTVRLAIPDRKLPSSMPPPLAVIRMPSEAAPRSIRVSASTGRPTWIGPPTKTEITPA